jgi:hypothetical protein
VYVSQGQDSTDVAYQPPSSMRARTLRRQMVWYSSRSVSSSARPACAAT